MPWCPICRTEYRRGFEQCSDCRVPLVEELEQFPVKKGQQIDDWSFLLETNNEYEVEVIVSLLAANSIPVLRKDQGAGGYLRIYMGMTNLGTELYVPRSQLEEAQILLNLQPEKSARKKFLYKESRKSDRKNSRRSFFMIWLVSILIGITLAFWETIKKLVSF